MGVRLRTCAGAVVVVAALAGCASSAHQATAGQSVPARPSPACPQGSPLPPGVHEAIDYTDSIWHDSRNYGYLPGVHLQAAQLGPVVTRIKCSLATADDSHGPVAHLANDTTTALPAGTAVYAIKGYPAACRLAAYSAGRLQAFLAGNSPDCNGTQLSADPAHPARLLPMIMGQKR